METLLPKYLGLVHRYLTYNPLGKGNKLGDRREPGAFQYNLEVNSVNIKVNIN